MSSFAETPVNSPDRSFAVAVLAAGPAVLVVLLALAFNWGR